MRKYVHDKNIKLMSGTNEHPFIFSSLWSWQLVIVMKDSCFFSVN